jgi:hypothetical protein
LNNILQKALDAIYHGDTKEALRLLRANKRFYPEFDKEIMMLSHRLENVRKDLWLDTQPHKEILQETNKITSAVYDLIGKIKEAKKDISTPQKEQRIISGADLLKHKYFPSASSLVPFGDLLEDLFFKGKYDHRYPIHGPNVIRFTLALFNNENSDSTPGLYKIGADGKNPWKEFNLKYYHQIKDALVEKENPIGDPQENEDSVKNLLLIAALFHDIGKSIKNAKHPEIGANLLRNFDENERLRLIPYLGSAKDKKSMEKNIQNRFALLTSIVQHHDKFGVVSTGEGAPPIFSDILYFTSGKENLHAIKKNVTAVMLLNLADIAAVNTANQGKIKSAAGIADNIKKLREKIGSGDYTSEDVKNEKNETNKLLGICMEESSCLGISHRKLTNVMIDWRDLIKAIDETDGSKLALKKYLLEREKTPSRAIERILRLVEESIITAEAGTLANQEYLSQTTVEGTLLSVLGTYQFLSFCEKYATVVKLDYGLRFFQSVVCACVRKKIYSDYEQRHEEAFKKDEENNRPTKSADRLTEEEVAELSKLDDYDKNQLAKKITSLIIKVLVAVISRYSSIFDLNTQALRRFGVEMTDLSANNQVWHSLIKQLCLDDDKESFALGWMIDEVTIWSFD